MSSNSSSEEDRKTDGQSDVHRMLANLKEIVDYLVSETAALEKDVEEIVEKVENVRSRVQSKGDETALALFLAMLMIAGMQQHHIDRQPAPPQDPQISFTEFKKALSECRKSKEPFECLEHRFFGG